MPHGAIDQPPLGPLGDAIVAVARCIPCVQALGLRVLECVPGLCRLVARHDRAFDGIGRSFHGGLLATAADCVAWFSIATEIGPHEPTVTTDLQIRYLNPCQGDVTAIGRVIKIGRTLCPVGIELFDPQGKAVAMGQVCYMRLGDSAKASANLRH